MKYALLAIIAIAAPMAPAAAAAQDAPTLNTPSANWNVYGPGQTHKAHKDKDVQGGGAMRVTIPSKPANVYDIGASTEIAKPIKKGDKLIFAFWVKLISGGVDGKSSLTAIIQRNTSPYDPIISGQVEITPAWKLVYVRGIANADYAAGTANAALSLGGAAHTFDLGPAFIMLAN
ncbi:MAG: hypothetical protein EOP60_15020 [Sphingomonadales bacterium]|nr:MAG: hypothetical protein EOP60_15020 [Sphingomonadales bacterium]